MPTINQLVRKRRTNKVRKSKAPALEKDIIHYLEKKQNNNRLKSVEYVQGLVP